MTHSHLTPEEIEFLRTGSAPAAAATSGHQPIDHTALPSPALHALPAQDMRRVERAFGDDQLRGIRAIHDQFARQAAEALQGPLSTPISFRVDRVAQRTFNEIVFGMQNPTCLQVLNSGQSALCPAIFEIPLGILFPMMDRLLGGREGGAIVPRALTEIERRLVGRLTGILLAQLSAAWARVAAVQWEVESLESNPQTVRCVPAGEPCAVAVMELVVGRARGEVRGVFPHFALEPMLQRIALQQGATEEGNAPQAGDSKSIAESVPLRVTLADSTLRRSDLLGLQAGDILATETDAGSPATVEVEGGAQFVARVGTHQGHKAVRIEGPREVSDQAAEE